MPNHVHGLIAIVDSTVGASLVGAQPKGTDAHRHVPPPSKRASTRDAPTPSPPLGDIIGAFKSITTVQYTRGVVGAGWLRFNKRLWQRNYYEHVLRGRRDLERIRRYVAKNPARWHHDRYHVEERPPGA